MSKLDLKADVGKNRLSFTLAGVINKKGLGNFYTELRFCVPDLQPGFEVIADLSGCTLAFLSIVPIFKNIMNYLLSNGAGEMVAISRRTALRLVLYRQPVKYRINDEEHNALFHDISNSGEIFKY